MRNVAFFLLVFPSLAFGAYEPPDPAYAPPGSYYANAVGTGATLKANLNTIVNTNFARRTYGDVRFDLAVTDRAPTNASNVLEIYNRGSVSGTWNGTTWNREHIWADTRLGPGNNDPSNGYSGPASDLFNLRPADVTINGNRGNLNFGISTSSGSYGPTSGYWFPGDDDKGDVARAMFYMTTAYSSLSLVNGNPAANQSQIGDLQALLKWHYTDGVDNFERRRNDVIYDTYQHNRNPYVDHPEYVWAVFGGSANNSQISVASSNVNLGTVFIGGTIPASNLMISKTGSTPTTYDITLGGSFVTTAAGAGQPFDYGTVNRTISVGLTSTSNQTAGTKTGTLTINNTDLTSAGAGQGSADADDSITVSATVIAHANPSFNSVTDQNSLTLNFGTVYVGSSPTLPLSINGLNVAPGFTAPLKLTNSSKTGDAAVTTNLANFNGLAAGSNNPFNVGINTSATGNYTAAYTLALADDVTIAGALSQQLTLNVLANVAYRLGDFNIDGLITNADIAAMLNALTDLSAYETGKSITPAALLSIGDLTGDGIVSNLDLQPLLNLVANTGSGSLASVPEPASLWLSAMGIACAFSTVRRRKACRRAKC
jgi:endonuclease I